MLVIALQFRLVPPLKPLSSLLLIRLAPGAEKLEASVQCVKTVVSSLILRQLTYFYHRVLPVDPQIFWKHLHKSSERSLKSPKSVARWLMEYFADESQEI